MTPKTAIKQLRKRPLFSQEIRDTIQRAILNEELKPGDRVVETRWARELGVSQSPVREAIRELEMMGLVESRPYQGAFVRTIDKSSIVDTYNVRRGLESVGIEAAVGKITDQQLVEIYIVMREMEQAVKDGNYELFVEKDGLFHEKILQVSGNKLLMQLWNQCKIREFTRISTYMSKIGVDFLAQRHGTMYEALAKRDAIAAVASVNEHFEFLIEQMQGIDLEDLQNRPNGNVEEKAS
ncbi:MAG: GntR family transcriptional regulator [Planctomycetaceae bacterium]|nr:GntR family transcriptional regulator [Planctomycetaceae bacterium]